ncbi:MAG: ATP-binding protein [Lentisphaeria bacterium]|jgi:signal transduction histidine kinase
MKGGTHFLDRLIGRLDRLDPASVQAYVLRLVREKGFLETVFNTIKEGVVVIDHDLAIQYVNRAARSLLGLGEICAGERIDRYLREVNWRRVMTGDGGEWQRLAMQEIEVFYPVHRLLRFYLLPYRDVVPGSDRIPMAVLILHDVTELRQDAQKNLESQRVKAITMLAAGVAHEIGNPLNSLTIHLQLLDRRLRKAPVAAAAAAELVGVALQEVQRLDDIVNNFLRAVRPVPPDLQPVALRELMQEALEFMRAEIEGRGVLVETLWPAQVPIILGDKAQLTQAFYNLLKNAIQAMPEGGLLRIAGEETDEFLELRFADSGKGIPAEVFPHLLEPYYTTRAGGSGLGLVIVDRIIRAHGGELGIETQPGEGTVFTLRLPLIHRRVRLLGAPAGEGAPRPPPPQGEGEPPWNPSAGKN